MDVVSKSLSTVSNYSSFRFQLLISYTFQLRHLRVRPARILPAFQMCHRQLRFVKSTGCGHLTFTGETNIDCRSRHCYISSSHPSSCGSSQAPCHCRRYYGQPQRVVTNEVSYSPPSNIVFHSSHRVILGSWQMRTELMLMTSVDNPIATLITTRLRSTIH